MAQTQRINLFSSLFRWAHRQDENFVTEGFAYLLNWFLQNEPERGRRFVRQLCSGEAVAVLDIGNCVRVTTQVTTDEGRPDVRIESERLLALVEIKKGSGLGLEQLDRYRRVLEATANGRTTRLILLTVFLVEFAEDEARPDVYVRWHQVADWLHDQEWDSEISQYLVSEFVAFLGEQIMTVEHVEWEYTEGVQALCRLTDMLGKALESAQVPIHARSGAWEYRGYYLDGKKFWAGIMYSRPNVLRFTIETKDVDLEGVKNLGRGEMQDGKLVFELDLSTEAVHFFARTKESQLEYLTEFVRSAYKDGQLCLANEQAIPR